MRYHLGESALLPTSGRDDSTREHLSSVEATTVLTATTTDEVENTRDHRLWPTPWPGCRVPAESRLVSANLAIVENLP
jgi:hypothetical protein